MKYLELIITQISLFQDLTTMIRISTSNDVNHWNNCSENYCFDNKGVKNLCFSKLLIIFGVIPQRTLIIPFDYVRWKLRYCTCCL